MCGGGKWLRWFDTARKHVIIKESNHFEFVLMKKVNNITQKTLTVLLSGKSKKYAKYAGKHVMVVENKVIPLAEGEKALQDFKLLKKQYGRSPVVTFVPRSDISYILFYARNG